MALLTELMPDSVPDPPIARTFTLAELDADTYGAMATIRRTGPAAITRNGRLVAVIVPVDDHKLIHAVLSDGPLAEEIHRRVAEAEADEGRVS